MVRNGRRLAWGAVAAMLLATLVGVRPATAGPLTFTYEVRGWDNTTDLEEFAARAAETYAGQAGWGLGGSISFVRVASGGSFTLWLSAPHRLPAFSSGCSTEYSCRVGRNVIINEARFRGGSAAWNATGASLRDYQHMVVNHETGHWLGFGHAGCPGAGAPAPVMQQQSKAMYGCRPNPWPTAAERSTLARWNGVTVQGQPSVPFVDPGWMQIRGTGTDIAMAQLASGWEMFHIGDGNAVFRRVYMSSAISDWIALPEVQAKRIAATTSPDGRAELFYIGMDNALYHASETSPGGVFGNAERFDGTFATAIAAARSGSVWEFYHVGADGRIWRLNDTERVWHPFAGPWASELAATTSDDGRVELLHIGRDGQTYHAWQTAPAAGFTGPGGPGTWQSLGDTSSAVAAANGIDGTFEVYTIGTGGSIWRLPPGGYPRGWQRVTGQGVRIAAANNPDGRIEIMHSNRGLQMYHAWQKRLGSY